MLNPLVVRRFAEGPRCWFLGCRVHHGAFGLLLALLFVVLRRPYYALAALALVFHDRADSRRWFALDRLSAAD